MLEGIATHLSSHPTIAGPATSMFAIATVMIFKSQKPKAKVCWERLVFKTWP